MIIDTVNVISNRGIYQGAVVMRMDACGRPELAVREFSDTPSAISFLEEIYAVTTRTPFAVYESWSYPIG